MTCSETNTNWFAVKAPPSFSLVAVVHATMKSALSSLTSERERLKQCLDHETCPPTSPQVVGLKNTLATVRENNTHADTEMLSVSRNRLGRTVTLLSDVVSSHTTHQA